MYLLDRGVQHARTARANRIGRGAVGEQQLRAAVGATIHGAHEQAVGGGCFTFAAVIEMHHNHDATPQHRVWWLCQW